VKYQKSNNYIIKGTKIIKVSTCSATILAVTLNEIFAGTHTSIKLVKILLEAVQTKPNQISMDLLGGLTWNTRATYGTITDLNII